MADSTDAKEMESWDVDEVSEFIKIHFSEEIGRKFKEQKMKGSLLRFFASNASIEQFVACGLEDIGSQMEFQRLVKEHTCHDEVNGSTVILTSSSSQSSDSFQSRSSHGSVKPSRNALRNMVPLDARIYKAKRRTVQEKAVMKWPGNNIPVFRKNVKALKELNELVEELAATCTYEPCGFTKEGIRKHILDTLNERRRRIKKGHDYTKGDARQKKHDSDDPNGKCNNELTWLTTEVGSKELPVDKDHEQHVGKSKADDHAISNTAEFISESETSEDGYDFEEQGPLLENADPKPKRKPEAVDHPTSKELLANTESEREDHFSEQQVLSSKRIDPKPKSKRKPKSKSTKETVDALTCKVGTSNAVDSMALSRKAAEVIICVAFNAINAKEISRSQLAAATKPLKLKLKPSLSKEEYLTPVANGLIKAGYIKLTKELSHDGVIVRDDIILLKPF